MHCMVRLLFSPMSIKMRLTRGVLSLIVGLPAFNVACWCQLAPSADASPVSTASSPPHHEESAANARRSANNVELYFTVADSRGEPIPHLTQQNCVVADDKEPQTLENFEARTGQALDVGVLLDTSGSQTRWFDVERDAAGEFVRQNLRSEDQALLLSFDVDLHLMQDYTNNPQLLMDALGKARIDDFNSPLPGPLPDNGPESTLFYDAITLAAASAGNLQQGRRAIVVLTDGDDHGSRVTSREALAALEKNNVALYVVWMGDNNKCLTPLLHGPREHYPPPQSSQLLDDTAGSCDKNRLNRCPGYFAARCLSEKSGGKFIDVNGKWDRLGAALRQIHDELRSQYWASFKSTVAKSDGSFHEIQVQCRGENGRNLRVQVRAGYYAQEP
jgi:VWFA-related protein